MINVGVSGPGVVSRALDAAKGKDFEFLCETIKRTAFKITRVGQLVAQELPAASAFRSASSTFPSLRPRL